MTFTTQVNEIHLNYARLLLQLKLSKVGKKHWVEAETTIGIKAVSS